MRLLFIFVFITSLLINSNAQDTKIDFIKDSTANLFAGYDNHIVVPKGAALASVDQKSGCTIAKLNDVTFSIKVSQASVGKKVKLKMIQKGKTTIREYKVKVMPKMFIFIGGINAETQLSVSKSNFLAHARNGLRFGFDPEAMLRVSYPMKKYHISIKVGGITLLNEDVENGKFSEKAMKLFKDQKYYTVECTKLYAEGGSGLMRNMEGFKLEVKE